MISLVVSKEEYDRVCEQNKKLKLKLLDIFEGYTIYFPKNKKPSHKNDTCSFYISIGDRSLSKFDLDDDIAGYFLSGETLCLELGGWDGKGFGEWRMRIKPPAKVEEDRA